MAESEMVEKVARRLDEEMHGGKSFGPAPVPDSPGGEVAREHDRRKLLRWARAAIEDMREPTEEMADDGGAYLDGFAALGDHTVVYAARGTWQTMIDHILEGPAVSTDAALSPSPAGEGR